MLYFTKYASKKFEILNQHKVFITKEQVEDAINLPNQTKKKGKYLLAEKEGIKVILKKTDNINKVITFYPTSN